MRAQRVSLWPLQISDVGVAQKRQRSSCLPASQMTLDSKHSSQCLCLMLQLPFNLYLVSGTHFTASSHSSPRPHAAVGSTPHLSSHLFSLQIFSFSTHFSPPRTRKRPSSILHASRAPQHLAAAQQGFSAQWGRSRLGMDDGIPVSAHSECNTRTLPDKRDVRH